MRQSAGDTTGVRSDPLVKMALDGKMAHFVRTTHSLRATGIIRITCSIDVLQNCFRELEPLLQQVNEPWMREC